MKKFINNIKAGFSARQDDERGDITQTIIIIAVMAAAAIAILAIVWNAIKGQGDRTAEQIDQVDTKVIK